MNTTPTRGETGLQLIEELIDEHVEVECSVIPIDGSTWAIHGSVAVDGNVILAEFATKDDAQAALAQIVAAQARMQAP